MPLEPHRDRQEAFMILSRLSAQYEADVVIEGLKKAVEDFKLSPEDAATFSEAYVQAYEKK